MATITTRSGKGSPLTNSEVDSNFSNINTELGQKESASNKGVANGYASLDGSGKVPSAQLPSYVDDVVEGANLASLPATGETGKIYVTLDTNKTYRWSGSAYVEISASPGSTDAVTEGSTNLYFTNARARSAISASGSLSYNSSTGVLSYTAPTAVSQLSNDSGYITSSALSSYLTSATAASTYQTALVSGTSIKTVNGNSLLGSGNIQIDAGVSSFNTRTGAITLTSGDVTTALGFTPYNATNPSGYITSSASITGASRFVDFLDNRAVNDQPQGKQGYRLSADFKENTAVGSPPVTAHASFSHILTIAGWDTVGGSGGFPSQMSVGDGIAVRQATNATTWGAWRTVLHSANYNSYSPTLTGTGASGTWGIRITGFANQGTARLYSTDAAYNYDSGAPYYGYLTYDGSRWLFQVSPGTPAAVRVAYADSAGNAATATTASNSTNLGGNASSYYDHRAYNVVNNYLGAYYVGGGEKPNDAIFGAGKLKLAMLSSGNLGFGGSWNDVLWLSSYSGGDVKPSYAIVGDKYSDELWFSRQNYDSATWGTGRRIMHSGNYSSYSAFSGLVTSSGNNGFANATWFASVRNPIWSFGNSSSYGISYFQGSAGRDGTDTITLHPNGSTTATGAAFAANGNNAFVNNNVVLNAANYTSYSPSLTGGGASGTWGISTTSDFLHSDRDFPSGTLITTDINYAVSSGDPFVLEIRGNSYGNAVPLDIQYQGYIYSDTIINHGGVSNGLNISGLVAINNGGNLCFWFPSQGYWNGYYVKVYVPYSGRQRNRVTSISGSGKPTAAKEVGLSANIRQSLHSGNYTSYSPSLTGSGASGTWGISISGSAAQLNGYSSAENGASVVLRTASNGYLYLYNWIHVASGGLFSGVNGAHLLPSDSTFGAWRISGSKNGYTGISTVGSSHRINWMVDLNGNLQGWYNESYGWQMYWSGGSLTVFKNSYGGGTAATVLDSANYTSYAPSLTGSGASGSWNITAARANRANGNFYIDDNYGIGIVGAYSPYRYQGVFAMGDSYKLPADGTTTGSLYGMAWSHPYAGGAAGNLTDHGLLIINNGAFKCAISNSIVASGNITAYSDERLKKNWRDMPDNFVERLSQVRVGRYERIDDGMQQVGVSAQSLQPLLPEAIQVSNDEIKTLSVSYGNAALAAAVELAKELVMLKRELAEIKSRLH